MEGEERNSKDFFVNNLISVCFVVAAVLCGHLILVFITLLVNKVLKLLQTFMSVVLKITSVFCENLRGSMAL